MDKLRIKMTGRRDRNGNEYYMSTTEVPCLIDLSKTVFHLFPGEDGENFWGELVIRKHDPDRATRGSSDTEVVRRKRRRKPASVVARDQDQDQGQDQE